MLANPKSPLKENDGRDIIDKNIRLFSSLDGECGQEELDAIVVEALFLLESVLWITYG